MAKGSSDRIAYPFNHPIIQSFNSFAFRVNTYYFCVPFSEGTFLHYIISEYQREHFKL